MTILDAIIERIEYLMHLREQDRITHDTFEREVHASIRSVQCDIEMRYGEEQYQIVKEFLLKYAGLIP